MIGYAACPFKTLDTSKELDGTEDRDYVRGLKRSSKWASVREAHLTIEPCCVYCGTKDELEVHHIKPFELYPSLELVESNLVTLCRHCHFWFGHFGNYRTRRNPDVRQDAKTYHTKQLEANKRYASKVKEK